MSTICKPQKIQKIVFLCVCNMNNIESGNNKVIMNGKGHKNGEAYKDKKETKRRKHRRRNSDPTKEECRHDIPKRHSDIFDVRLRHRITNKQLPKLVTT